MSPEGEAVEKVKHVRENRGRAKVIDKKLTGLGTGVLGDLSESLIHRQPTEGKNLREE